MVSQGICLSRGTDTMTFPQPSGLESGSTAASPSTVAMHLPLQARCSGPRVAARGCAAWFGRRCGREVLGWASQKVPERGEDSVIRLSSLFHYLLSSGLPLLPAWNTGVMLEVLQPPCRHEAIGKRPRATSGAAAKKEPGSLRAPRRDLTQFRVHLFPRLPTLLQAPCYRGGTKPIW